MIKKLFKILIYLMLLAVLLLAIGGFVLYKMYPPAKLKVMAQQYVADNFQRELTFDEISFTWIGFTLTNVALSENSTFQNGTFVKADKVTAHVAVRPLLKKRIEVSTIEADGLAIHVIQQKDGKFNFSTLIPEDTSAQSTASESSAQEKESAFVFTAESFILKDCDITYQNEQTGLQAAVNDLNIEIGHFGLARPFNVLVSFKTEVSALGQPKIQVPVQIASSIFLADLDLPRAMLSITQASFAYQTINLNFKGDVSNFENPSINLTGTLSGITNGAFSAFAPDLPNFQLPAIALTLQAQADIAASTANITQARLSVQDSFLSAQGSLDWGHETPAYQLAATLQANLEQIVKMTDTLDGFSPGGSISGRLNATEKKNNTDVRGTVTLKDVSAFYEPFTLTHTNGVITLASLTDISSSGVTGKLNEQPFTLSFSYKEIQDIMNIVLNLNLDKLVLQTFPASKSSEQQPAETTQTTSTDNHNPLKMNVKANVTVGEIDIPYLQSEGFVLAADLTDVTDTLAQTNGTISFALQPGKITNLDNFIKDSKVAKIVLLPVAVIKKVSGLLRLNLFPAENSPRGTTLSFTQAQGQYTFADGVMNLDQTVFNSSVTNMSASGTADFNTQALNMRATATLLTQAAPIAIKITGTVSEPKGKLDVVNTVTSVVGGILNGTAVKSVAQTGADATTGTAKLATNTVKGTVNTAADLVKGIGGLFKKKQTQEENN